MTVRVSPITKFLQLPSKMYRRARHFGVWGTIDWMVYQFTWRLRVWRLGIRTGEWDHSTVVGDEGHNHLYEPVDVRCFEQIIGSIPFRSGEEVLLDYGSGKGLAVILAARKPYRCVIGVERNETLAEIAREHISRVRRKLRCQDLQIVCSDAAGFEVPDDVTQVFLFNPFSGAVLASAMRHVEESLQRSPRRLSVLYLVPNDWNDELADLPWLTRRGLLSTGFWDHLKCIHYEHVPDESANLESADHVEMQTGVGVSRATNHAGTHS